MEGCSILGRSRCIGSYIPYSGVPPSGCAQGGGGEGYAEVRGGRGYAIVWGVRPNEGVRPNAPQGAHDSITGTTSTATTASSAMSTRDVAWGDDAAWQCISSSISYYQSGDHTRPPFGPLHSPSALTFPCSLPPRTSIPFEQPQMSVLSSDSVVYVFAIRIQKVLNKAIFESYDVLQASPDEGCNSGWEITGLRGVDESEARATRTRGSTIGENLYLSRLDGVARQLWSVLSSVELLLELVAQRYDRFYGVPLISDKPFKCCFAVLLNVRTRYDGSVACLCERPSCCCRRHP